tara:strand:- start:112 stop:465 length:354 start_codon:yes stop_codon:yes gene_type:complete
LQINQSPSSTVTSAELLLLLHTIRFTPSVPDCKLQPKNELVSKERIRKLEGLGNVKLADKNSLHMDQMSITGPLSEGIHPTINFKSNKDHVKDMKARQNRTFAKEKKSKSRVKKSIQ